MHPADDGMLAGIGRDRVTARGGSRAVRIGGMPDASGDLAVSARVVVPASELRWRFSRSSGPGGQGVNTADSRVELIFDLATTTALPPHLHDGAINRRADRLSTARSSLRLRNTDRNCAIAKQQWPGS